MKQRLSVLFLCLLILCLFVACNGDITDNPLGYSFAGQMIGNQKHTVSIPPSNAKPVAHLRMYGIGLPPDAFITQYGAPLSPSQPPTQLWFKASLDTFPGGSVMIVAFDRSSFDNAPRATEISYVAGDNHPTTDSQAETITESFLPDDTQGPTLIHKYDTHTNTCQSEEYISATLARLFPPQDFLDATGATAKPGTVTLSLFPHYTRTFYGGVPTDQHANELPDQPNAVSSFLITLGTKPYC